MVSLQPVKPTIISFLCPQFKPTIDVCKPLYKSNVVNAGLSSYLLGEHSRVVYITYTMATQNLPGIYARALRPTALGPGHISGKSLVAMV